LILAPGFAVFDPVAVGVLPCVVVATAAVPVAGDPVPSLLNIFASLKIQCLLLMTCFISALF
jgi:hypothetical protein